MYEYFSTIEEAQAKAHEIYPDKQFEISLGSPWVEFGYITEIETGYRLQTNL